MSVLEIEKLRKPDLYPRISFLGTSSAVPSKYRNVTGYLVEVAADTALMVDVGEGSYGQMKIILGYSGVEEVCFHSFVTDICCTRSSSLLSSSKS